MAPISPPGLPPASAEFTTLLHLAGVEIPPPPAVSRMFRSADGKIRTDAGQNSVINIPSSKQTILLNHAKKEAHIIPMPDAFAPPPPPAVPGMPAPLKPPSAPAMDVKDLGKKMMEGHEVHGKEFTIHPPHVQLPHFPTPPMPAPPKVDVPTAEVPKVDLPTPGAPALKAPAAQVPGMTVPAAPRLKVPGVPDAPKPPAAPQVPAMLPPPPPLPPPSPVVTEVWTTTQHSIPMLTKTTGSFGKQISQCRRLVPGEPPPSVFQIPPDYKIV